MYNVKLRLFLMRIPIYTITFFRKTHLNVLEHFYLDN